MDLAELVEREERPDRDLAADIAASEARELLVQIAGLGATDVELLCRNQVRLVWT